MSTFTVRCQEDAWRAFDLLAGGENPNVRIRFSNCVITVGASERIDGMSSAQAFIALQRAIRRQFSWIKYGKRRGRLTDPEKSATTIVPTYHPNGCLICYDITNALNALAEAAERVSSIGREWWARTTRAIGHLKLGDLPARDRSSIAKLAVVMIALAHMTPGLARETFTFVAGRMDAYAARQERLMLAEKTTVVTYTRKEAKLQPAQMVRLEEEVTAERRRMQTLISDNIDTPILRFVVAEVEAVTPALLSMAPERGTFSINGDKMDAGIARAGARVMRKFVKERRDNGGWNTETIPAREI